MRKRCRFVCYLLAYLAGFCSFDSLYTSLLADIESNSPKRSEAELMWLNEYRRKIWWGCTDGGLRVLEQRGSDDAMDCVTRKE